MNLVGQRFGRLVVLEQAPKYNTAGGNPVVRWRCRCDCGNETIAFRASLRQGNTRSCGKHMSELAKQRMTTHGGTHTSEYTSWKHMKSRCNNPRYPRFADWGGRGIKVCDRWIHSFSNFIADMGPKPTPSHTIDRKNNDGNYTPDNCRWATKKEQQANTRPYVRFAPKCKRPETLANVS